MLASGGSSCHRFGGTDEVVGRLEVEEIEVLEVVVFGRLENVERHTQDFVCLLVDGVEEVEENLAVLVTQPTLHWTAFVMAYLQPLVDDVHLLCAERPL